jgi:hypothetical protein
VIVFLASTAAADVEHLEQGAVPIGGAGVMRASSVMVGGREEGVPADAVGIEGRVEVERLQEVAFPGEQVAHAQAHTDAAAAVLVRGARLPDAHEEEAVARRQRGGVVEDAVAGVADEGCEEPELGPED